MASPRSACLLLALSLISCVAVPSVAAATPPDAGPTLIPGGPVIDGDLPTGTSVEDLFSERSSAAGAPDDGLTARVTTGIYASFETDVPPAVAATARAALDHWDAVLAFDPASPVEVRFRWEALGPRVLGYGGPTWFVIRPELGTDQWPVALANTVLGVDQNSATPEIVIGLNSDLAWHLDPSTAPPADRADLFTTVLHEVAHGLGFVSSVSLDGGRLDPGLHLAYDRLLVTGPDRIPLSTLAPERRAAALTSSLAVVGADGVAWPIFSPADLRPASTASHFDEDLHPFGSAGSLMSPAQRLGEAERGLDAPTIGVLAAIGWPISAPVLAPTQVSSRPTSTGVEVRWSFDQRMAAQPGAWVRVRAAGQDGSVEAVVGAALGSIRLDLAGTPTEVSVTALLGGRSSPAVDAAHSAALTHDGAVIRALYRAALDREPDPLGMAFWLGRLRGGEDLRQVAAWFVTAPEYRDGPAGTDDTAFLTHLYRTVLQRTPDPDGWIFWSSELAGGRPRSELMATFVDSAEVDGIQFDGIQVDGAG